MTRRATFIDKDEKPHTIEFNDQPFTEGGEGALYHTPDKRFVVKTYHPHIGARKNLKAVQEILLAAPKPENDAYPYLAWPTGVLWDGATVGGVIMPNASYDIWMDQLIWYTHPRMLLTRPQDRRGDLKGRVKVAIALSGAVRYLNFLGYAHADLSGRNFLVNLVQGRGVLIDLDGLVVPKYMEGVVIGTPGFMAPELVEGMIRHEEVRPTKETDRHALAVCLFMLLTLRHPLTGGTRKPLHDDPNIDDLLQTGPQAVYIEHPTDSTNRPPKGEHIHSEWFGDEIANLFRRSFVDGLHDAAKRPHPYEYEQAFKHLLEDLTPCGNPECPYKYFASKGGEVTTCPICGSKTAPKRMGVATCYRQKKAGFFSAKQKSDSDIFPKKPLTRADVFGRNVPNPKLQLLTFIYRNNDWIVELRDRVERAYIIEKGGGLVKVLEHAKPTTLGKDLSLPQLYIALDDDYVSLIDLRH